MAANTSTLLDQDGDSSDWIEIQNAGDAPLELAGWHLTDDAGDLRKWTFPATTLEAGASLVIFASDKDHAVAGQELHTNFRLSSAGEYLALVAADGTTIVDSFAPAFPVQFEDVSYGTPTPAGEPGYFLQPTPGRPNPPDTVADPTRRIVINEIMYHPPSGRVEEEYIEVYNAGETSVDLTGWQFTSGVEFQFPNRQLSPGGYLVVAANVESFVARYGAQNVLGPWEGQLANGGERLELVDQRGLLIDRVTYADEGDWSQRLAVVDSLGEQGLVWSDQHDGGGSSLELVQTELSNDVGQNWLPSPVDGGGGTPGRANAARAADVAPLIWDVAHFPPIPTSRDQVRVSARLVDEGALTELNLPAAVFWRVGSESFTQLALRDDGEFGDLRAADGVWSALLPAHTDNTVVEFYVSARDVAGNVRSWPAPVVGEGQIANALYQVDDRPAATAAWTPGSPSTYYQIMTTADRERFERLPRDSNAELNATLIAVTGTGTEVRYGTGVRIRGSGSRSDAVPNNRVNIPADRPLFGMTAMNFNQRGVANQVAGSVLFGIAGIVAAEAEPVVLYSNGENLKGDGWYALVEPLNQEFVSNHFPLDAAGNLYQGRRPDESPPGGKGAGLQYFGEDPLPYVSYFKQNNARVADYSDVIRLTDALNNSTADQYITAIEEVLDVDQWLRFLAVNALLNNSEYGLATGDPLGDDYALYRGVADQRFQLLPHDLDSLFANAGQENNGITRWAFLATNVPALGRLLRDPRVLPRYYHQLEDVAANVLTQERTYGLLREALRGILAPTQIQEIGDFLQARAAYVLGTIPDAELTVNTSLPLAGTYRRTTVNQLLLEGTVPTEAQAVLVNGRPAVLAPLARTWTFDAAALPAPLLLPGINRILVAAFDNHQALGAPIDEAILDVWYDDGSLAGVPAVLPDGVTTWTASAGPYLVSEHLLVPAGATLVIEPGTSVYFAAHAELEVQGILQALGTATERIRWTAVPDSPSVPDELSALLPAGPPHWDGVHFVNSRQPQNRISYVDIEYAQDSRGSIGLLSSDAVIDHVTFRGSHLRYLYSENGSLVVRDSVFPDMFAEGERPLQLGLDNLSEQIKSIGGIPEQGQFIVQNNIFGTNKGHNDIIDVDSGTRPGPIAQILDNTFWGSGDEALDLGGDAYVAGNRFLNIHKDSDTSDRGYASGISAGDTTAGSTLVVARNLFWNVDHAVNLKNGAVTIFENNTVAGIHDDFVDRFGNLNVGSVINFFVDEPFATTGSGAYLAGNVLAEVPRAFGNIDRRGTETMLQFAQNLLPASLARNPLSESRLQTLLDLGSGNLVGDAMFRDALPGDARLEPFSQAIGTGPLGIDMGAAVPVGLAVSGLPAAGVAGSATTILTIGGPGIFAFRYRLNEGPWSEPLPIGAGFQPAGTNRTAELSFTGLSEGRQQLELQGQDFAGVWQADTTVVEWLVAATQGTVLISEVLASNLQAFDVQGSHPDYVELHNFGSEAVNLRGYSLSDSPARLTRFVFPDDLILPPGGYLVVYADEPRDAPGIWLGFGLDKDGDAVYLSAPAGPGGAADVVLLDAVEFGPQIADLAVSRVGAAWTWQLSAATPGAANQVQATSGPAALRINEWLASAAGEPDFVELYNPAPLPVALGSLYLTDELAGAPTRQRIKPLSFVAADGFVSLQHDQQATLEFGLNARREILALLDADQQLLDVVAYRAQTAGWSQGRTPDGADQFAFFATPTPGRANLPRLAGDLNADDRVDAADIDALAAAIRLGATAAEHKEFDLDENGILDPDDLTVLVEEILHTRFGDVNLDGEVQFDDFVLLAINFGRAEATWADGNFDFDNEVNFSDFVLLALHFGFQ